MQVNIAHQFTFTHQDGTTEVFRPGAYDLEDELANHWYVQAHAEQDQDDGEEEQNANTRRRRRLFAGRMRAGTPQHERQMNEANALNSLDDDAMAQEIAQAAADIREKYAKNRVRRPGERAKLDEDVVKETRRMSGESPEDEDESNNEGNGQGNPEGRDDAQQGDQQQTSSRRRRSAENGDNGNNEGRR